MLHHLALPVTPWRQKGTVLRAADRISSLSLRRNGWMKSNVHISFHFFAFVYSYVPDAKLGWAQSRLCARRLFSRLSEPDWGPQLTRGCRHLPQTGAMTLVVAGEEVARGGRYSSKMPSGNRVQMLFVTLNKKKNCPAATEHPPCLRRRHSFGLTLQLFVGK